MDCKATQPVHPKGNQSWIFIGRTDAKAETLILWPPDSKNWLIWTATNAERLKVGGEGDDRGWDGWMLSPTQWTWVWKNSRSWRWTGRPGVLQSMGLQRVRHDWATELNWAELNVYLNSKMNKLISSIKNEPRNWQTFFMSVTKGKYPSIF